MHAIQLSSRQQTLSLAEPVVMGILNATPDSFSDGGQFLSLDAALRHAEKMYAAGAAIIDVGGESSRPSATPVGLEEELDRVIPLIEGIAARFPVWISVDTYKAQVMQAAVEAGAHMINDIYALRKEGALQTVAALNVPVCLMHMQGTPQTMQNKPSYQSVTAEVEAFLAERIQCALAAGISPQHIVIDPGFGFGKTLENNFELLAQLSSFKALGYPILSGTSRKSKMTRLYQPESGGTVLAGSLSTALLAVLAGAHILRVHDVPETVAMLRIFLATRGFQGLS